MRGGASRIAELQVRMLETSGHEVRVWRPESPWLKWIAPLRLIGHLTDLLPQANVAKEILEWEPNVLLTHNLTGCGFGTPSYVQRHGIRWVHVLHDVQLFEPSGRLRDAKPITRWQKIWSGMRRNALGQPNLTLSPTAWLLEQHQRRGLLVGSHAELLPNPAPEIAFALRAPGERLALLFVGGTKEKGLGVVQQIEERAALSVKKLFDASQEDVMDSMRQADILLFPSQIMENQPTVLLEAAAVGLPVIAADVGGVRETLNGAGIIVPKDDVSGWIETIEFLRDPNHYRDHSTKMYELAKAHDPREYHARFERLITSGQI